MKNKTIITSVFLAVLFTSTLYLLYINQFKSPSVNTSTPTAKLIPTNIPEPSIIPTIVPTTSPISNWKTYSDSNYKISFKYPDTWEAYSIGSLPNITLMIAPKKNVDSIRGNPGFGGGKFMTMLINSYPKTPIIKSDETSIVTKKNDTLSGLPAIKYSTEITGDMQGGFNKGDKTISYVVKHGDNYLNIELLNLVYESTLNQILSTFKFTNTIEETALGTAKKYLDSYISGNWSVVKEISEDINFDDRIASSYGITKYTIISSKVDAKDQNYYHVYVDLTTSDGQIHKISPGGTQIEVLMHKNTSGNWKAVTWYFFQ